MAEIVFIRRIYNLSFPLKASFSFNRINIWTITDSELKKIAPPEEDEPSELFGIKLPKKKERKSEFGYLMIDATCELEPYDSVMEGSAIIRPHLLIIYGIISYLTNQVLVPFQNFHSASFIVEEHLKPIKKTVLKHEGKTLKKDLDKIFDVIHTADTAKQNLIYSIFDRWRKALYHEERDEESLMYKDESILAFVHVIEVLADEYKSTLVQNLKTRKAAILKEICALMPSKTTTTSNMIKSLMIEYASQVTLKSKIEVMLQELNLYSPKIESIISRFIDHRNAIAHGRKDIYQEKLIYPLPPFFSQVKDSDEYSETIKIISAKCIAEYLGLDSWNIEFLHILLYEYAPLEVVKRFIAQNTYSTVTNDQFLKGLVDEISPITIHYYFIKGKISFKDYEQCLTPLFETMKLSKELSSDLFGCAVTLADSLNLSVSIKAKELIKQVDKNKWGHYSNIRDVLKHHEYHGKTPVWFKAYLIQRATS